MHIDHRLVYRGHPRYPKNVATDVADRGGELMRCSIGEGFDGQMASVYVFVEPVTQVWRSVRCTMAPLCWIMSKCWLVSLPCRPSPTPSRYTTRLTRRPRRSTS